MNSNIPFEFVNGPAPLNCFFCLDWLDVTNLLMRRECKYLVSLKHVVTWTRTRLKLDGETRAAPSSNDLHSPSLYCCGVSLPFARVTLTWTWMRDGVSSCLFFFQFRLANREKKTNMFTLQRDVNGMLKLTLRCVFSTMKCRPRGRK